MVQITLPDGSKRSYTEPMTALAVAADIGPGLAKAMLAAEIDGKLVDASTVIESDAVLRIITGKDPEGLEVIRHSTAHLLAQAVKRLYPEVQVTIGPVIEDGFYYDFYYPDGFSVDHLADIEAMMQRIVKENLTVSKKTIPFADAVAYFRSIGEEYKAEIIEDLGEAETLTTYSQGDFTDLCRGPHVPSTAHLGAFKLTKVAGAYWRGDSNNPMLQRIYGTAWGSTSQLKAHLHLLEEAKKRDHRKLGQKLGYFHIQDIGPGMVFWHPKGWDIYQRIVQYIRQVNKQHGYQEIQTPQILDKRLWEASGHWDKFQENMYITQYEDRSFAVKPMSCPGHIQVFNHHLHSYKDLPLKYAEFGCCHRKEPSGSLHGLIRVRGFVQDDGHIFCTESQIEAEVLSFIKQVEEVYHHFGFEKVSVMLSTRPETRVGDDAVWDKAEAALERALNASGLEWGILPGEGAFYGPKLEFSLKDCLGRPQQCGTIQLDFSMPERLGATYVDADNSKKVPVMLHRAVLGSIERFFAILLEEYAGSLPFWLVPTQLVVANIGEHQVAYANDCVSALQAQGYRAIADVRNENIGYKIRGHSMDRVPYILVVGEREQAAQVVAVRTQAGENLGTMSMEQLLTLLATQDKR
jgi:threonyl-tRNA synthetase